MSDSEEDEYNNTGIVYDSENSDEDFDSEDEELVRTTTLSYQWRHVFDTTCTYVCYLIYYLSQ